MENYEMEGHKPISSFQLLQKTILGDTSSSQPPINNPPTMNEVSCVSSVDSRSKLVEQFPEGKPSDMALNYDQYMKDLKKQRRITSKRVSSLRSRLKKKIFLANLEVQATTLENQLARLKSLEAFHQNQKQMMMVEEHALCQEIEFLEKEKLLRDVEDEKNIREANRLKELQIKKNEQVESWLLNRKHVVSDDQMSNCYANSYQGNGVETPYIPPQSSQMWIYGIPNMDETFVTLPNFMGSMDQRNHISNEYASNPNLN
ncbi:uncharacterized protein LOC109814794 isoform X2 [Cajanus cajan]|uniref:uncharacterized protein LOC109814794 isoform X2 n=1 Tax=Cajanus cajan TaxID=3821 RepID=UPI00098DB6CC|nr:uncharacterized protein LOC109814794 isoform X2 [Cajanus cajan]